MSTKIAKRRWALAARHVRGFSPGTYVRFPKHALPNPREAGARVSVGLPVGQLADYRFPPDRGCTGIHVHEHHDHWAVHLDRVHPDCDVIEHVRRDAPDMWCLSGAVLGAMACASLSKHPSAALVGAGVGLLLALATRDDRFA